MRRPFVDAGTNAIMFAAEVEAVAVGARVEHAVCAANVTDLAYGVCAKIGVEVTATG